MRTLVASKASIATSCETLALLHDEVAIEFAVAMVGQHEMRARWDRLAVPDDLHRRRRGHDMLHHIAAPDRRVVDQCGQVGKSDTIGFRVDLPADKQASEDDGRGDS